MHGGLGTQDNFDYWGRPSRFIRFVLFYFIPFMKRQQATDLGWRHQHVEGGPTPMAPDDIEAPKDVKLYRVGL